MSSRGAASHQIAHIRVIVLVGVAHIAPPYDQRMVEQRAIPIGNRLQLLQEISDALAMISIDPCVLFEPLRVLTVVRSRVVAGLHSGLGIAAKTYVASDHQRRDSGDVPLKREDLQ